MPSTITRDDLLEGLTTGAIQHFFQPIWNIDGRRIEGVEALVRWQHPTLGLLGPAEFLGLITEFELTDELTRRSVSDAVAALPRLQTALDDAKVYVAVNLSSAQIRRGDTTVDIFSDALGGAIATADSLVVEMVEDLSRTHVPLGAPTVAKLRERGVRVFLDDFGTGAGTLSLLTDLGYDGLKIDRHFITRITTPGPARSVVEAIVAFADSRDITVVAEGIEDNFTLDEVRKLGCRRAQGYLLGRPLALDELISTHTGSDSADAIQGGSVAPVSPQAPPIDAAALAARIASELPFGLALTVDEISQRASALERLARTLPSQDESELVFDVAWRKTHAAMGCGATATAISWGLDAARRAEALGRPGRAGWMLSMLACMIPHSESDRIATSHALAQALDIRAHVALDDEERITIDNNLGALLGNLGLHEEALHWFLRAAEYPTTVDCRGRAMACLNVADAELARLEGDTRDLRPTPRAISVQRIEHALIGVDTSKHAEPSVYAALSARLALQSSDLKAARSHLSTVDHNGGETGVSLYLVALAEALVARADNDVDAYLGSAEQLLDLLASHAMIRHHRLRAERIYADALAFAGRHREAYEFLVDTNRHDIAHGSAQLQGFFDWMRISVNLDHQYDEVAGTTPPDSSPTRSQ